MKYYTYEQLKKFNASSIRLNRNRNFKWGSVNKQIKVLSSEMGIEKEDLKFPVITSMIHNEREFRTAIALGRDRIYLDISFKQYSLLNDDQNVGDTEFLIS